MDKKWIVRILCGILAAIMLLGIIPFGVFAEEASGTPRRHPSGAEESDPEQDLCHRSRHH